MYIPAPFRVDDPAVLERFIAEHSFALLCIKGAEGLEAVHLPLLYEQHDGAALIAGHVARANPIWRAFDGREALCIFSGPHAYISPRWYVNATNVPTWNYSAVHAYGAPRIIEEPEAVQDYIARLVDNYEAGADAPWSLGQAEPQYLSRLWNALVMFEMPLTRVEGKFKLSQNRRPEDYAGALAGLSALGTPAALDVAALMRVHGRRDAGADSGD